MHTDYSEQIYAINGEMYNENWVYAVLSLETLLNQLKANLSPEDRQSYEWHRERTFPK